MNGVRGEHKTPGEFRISQNWIGGSMPSAAVYVPPPHTEVAECLSDFEKFINNEEIDTPDLIKIAILHYQFESIHPFLDANGRISFNKKLSKYKDKAKNNLLSKQGFHMRGQRLKQVKRPFAQIKWNKGFKRFLLRGLKKVDTELAIICMAFNIEKLFKKDISKMATT